jgi:hypothetical protein
MSWQMLVVLVIAAGTVLALGVWAVDEYRARRRRREPLRYVVPRPEAKGASAVGRAFGEAAERMVYGTSAAEWKRRCEASLRTSRRRRGLDA